MPRMEHPSDRYRLFDVLKLFITLDAGAIVLLTAFVRELPDLPEAREAIGSALNSLVTGFIYFLLSFVAAWGMDVGQKFLGMQRIFRWFSAVSLLVGMYFFLTALVSLQRYANAVISSQP